MFRLVEIELFSYCNRKCGWCPNNYIDRKSQCKYLNTLTLISLLNDLKSIEYDGAFSFSRYNEPFYDIDCLNENIRLIKSYFPEAKMVSNTNGDYIDENVLKNMLIDELSIMDYDSKGRDKVLSRLEELRVKDIQEYDNYFVGKYEDKKILYYYNWNRVATISDRGGNLKKYSKEVRSIPCFEPLYFIGINYDGTVSPCCNVRNDCSNRKYIIGDLNYQSLQEILESEKYKKFVEATTNALYTEDMPCYYCSNKGGRYTREKGGILYE